MQEQEYKFEIEIEGLDGILYYSLEAESEQEARDAVNYLISNHPFGTTIRKV